MNRIRPSRRRLFAAASGAALLLVPAAAGAANIATKFNPSRPAAAPLDPGLFPPPPRAAPDQKIAVVLASAFGVEITDFVAPYEILGRSGAYQVYALAPERTLLPFVNANMADTSLDFVPHFSFQEYDALVDRAPDVIVVPWVPGHTPERDAAMIEWIRASAGPNTTLLTICAGTQILAETGLMRGHSATTNVARFESLRTAYPDVSWVRGVRYHDDGTIITSTNVAAGIDAALHTVDRLVGRAAALSVARDLGYGATHYLDDPRFTPAPPAQWLLGTAPVALSAAIRWPQRELGVLLHDGVDELALGAILDFYGSSCAARTHVVAAERGAVRSRSGLTLVPRYDAGTAPGLDRVVLPAGASIAAAGRAAASWSAARPDHPVVDIHGTLTGSPSRTESVYDQTLRDLAGVEGRAVARGIGRALFYAVDDSIFS